MFDKVPFVVVVGFTRSEKIIFARVNFFCYLRLYLNVGKIYKRRLEINQAILIKLKCLNNIKKMILKLFKHKLFKHFNDFNLIFTVAQLQR